MNKCLNFKEMEEFEGFLADDRPPNRGGSRWPPTNPLLAVDFVCLLFIFSDLGFNKTKKPFKCFIYL